MEIVESRYRIRRISGYPCHLQSLCVDPCLMRAAAQYHDRLICAYAVKKLLFRSCFIKYPFSVSESEIRIVIRILHDEAFYSLETFLNVPLHFKIYSAQIMSSQNRVAMTVYKARKHHLSLQVTNLCRCITECTGAFIVTCINYFISFYCNSLCPFKPAIYRVYFSVCVNLVCSHIFLLYTVPSDIISKFSKSFNYLCLLYYNTYT